MPNTASDTLALANYELYQAGWRVARLEEGLVFSRDKLAHLEQFPHLARWPNTLERQRVTTAGLGVELEEAIVRKAAAVIAVRRAEDALAAIQTPVREAA